MPAVALLGAAAATLLAVGPVPELGFVLQGSRLGALIGALLGERRKRRDPEYDAAPLIIRWSILVAALFAVGAAIARVF